MFHTLWGYNSRAVNWEVNLPGTGDTVINQAVPPGGDSGIALCWVEACDLLKRGRLGCAIFGRGGLRSRIPHPDIDKNQILHAIYQTSESSWHSGARPIDYSVWWRFFLSFQSILNNPILTDPPTTLILQHQRLFLELTTWQLVLFIVFSLWLAFPAFWKHDHMINSPVTPRVYT